MLNDSFLLSLLFTVPPFIIAIVLHEVAHGYVAFKLGDPTAKALGRITLNPISHIDLFLSIILPGLLILSGSPIIFGGAKPVPVNPTYFKNPRRDMAIVAAAGPLTNFVLAFLAYLLLTGFTSDNPSSFFPAMIYLWLMFSIIVNLVLGIFNLLPVPPLDGGRIMVGILPITLARKLAGIEKYGILVIFALLMFGLPQKVLDPAITFISDKLIAPNEMINGTQQKNPSSVKPPLAPRSPVTPPHKEPKPKSGLSAA